MSRNVNIDIVKVFACIAITIAHLGLMGYIQNINGTAFLVFFFVVSGYFTMVSIENARKKGIEYPWWGLLWHKFKSLFPYVLASEIAILGLIFYTNLNYYHNTPVESLFQTIATFFGDVSCLTMFGLPKIQGDVALWYISGLLVAIAVTYPFIVRYREKFTMCIAPLISMFMICYMLRTTGTVLNPYDDAGELSLFIKGTLSSVAFVCLGYFCYECSQKLSKINFTRAGAIILAVVELFLWGLSFYTCFEFNSYTIYGFVYIELLSIVGTIIATTILFSQRSAISIDADKHPKLSRFCAKLGLFTFLMYICQYYQMYFASHVLADWSIEGQCIFMIVSIALSIVFTYYVGRLIIKLGSNLKAKIISDQAVSTT